MADNMTDRVMLLDGNNLFHRAFHAIRMLTTSDGVPTNAVMGFMRILNSLLKKEKPAYFAVAFDTPEPTFRRKAYEAYKAGRSETPPELISQFELLDNLLNAMGVPILKLPGYEADDLLGTVAAYAEREGLDCLIVTGDKDALQLISQKTHILQIKKNINDAVEVDPDGLYATYGLAPERMIDLKGLMGDKSDNIPGVPGVGETTALKLLLVYGTLEEVLEAAERGEIRGKVGENIKTYREQALESRVLGTICRDCPLELDWSALKRKPLGSQEAVRIMKALELESLLGMIEISSEPEQVETPVMEQPELPVIICKPDDELPMPSSMVSVYGDGRSLSWCDGNVEYRLPLQLDLLSDGWQPDDAYTACKTWLENETIFKILHDGKSWRRLLSDFSITLRGLAFDTMIAAYLLDPSARSYDVSGEGAGALWIQAHNQREQLEKNGMTELFEKIEMPLVSVLSCMEEQGFLVDLNVLAALGAEYAQRIDELQRQIHELAGHVFNINSTKQLGVVLFEELGLPTGKKTKTGYSTDSTLLEGLMDKHPIIALVMEYRQLTKLKSTYVDGLTQVANPATSRIHSTLHQTVTATGRLSSSEPNLQNIPIREERGKPLRRAFVAASGWRLVDADYSQIELRVLAHMCNDDGLKEAFLSGQDFHRHTASEVFGVSIQQVTSYQRSAAKAVNFGIVYGISDFGLARQLGISRSVAGQYIKAFLAQYPGVNDYMQRTVNEGREQGYVSTLFGRRRPLPELQSSAHSVRAFGERMAMNTPIQGTAADIIKLAMVRVHDRLRKEQLKAQLVLQVHDELIVTCPENETSTVAALLKEEMENAASLSVPILADVSIGSNWEEAKG